MRKMVAGISKSLSTSGLPKLNYKIPQKGVIDWLLRENYRGAAVF